MPATHYRTCNLCEALCGLAIEREDGRVRSIRGDDEDVFSHGHICPKAVALQDLHEDPDRLRRPMRRRGSTWEEVGWDEALDEAADRLAAIQDRHGRNAVGVYQGNPVAHGYGLTIFGQLLLRALRTRNRFSATSVDQLPHMLASLLMFGHQLRLPVPDVDRTQHFLMLGANPLASNGSLMTAPDIAGRLKALRARGGKLVVVDPRRTETAAVADQHVPIRPGTDALLLLGMIHTLFATDRVRPGRLAAFTDGIDTVAALARDFAPETVAGPTGVPADVVRRLATELADSPAGVCYGRVGVSTQEFGGLACWLINVVNVLVGSLDRPGGADVPAPGRGRDRARHAPRPARPLRQGTQPRARAAGVRRRVPGEHARRGDRDGRARPDPRPGDDRGQPRVVHAERPAPRRAPSSGWTSWSPWTPTGTRPRATRT